MLLRLAAIVALLIALVLAPIADGAPLSQATYRIMPLGDSITYGCCSDYTWGAGYRHYIDDDLRGTGVSFSLVGDYSVGVIPDPNCECQPGYLIEGWMSAIQGGLFTRISTSTVLILLGTNNLYTPVDVQPSLDKYNALLDAIWTAVPSMTVIAATVPTNTRAVDSTVITPFNTGLVGIVNTRHAAGKSIFLADPHATMTLADLGADGLHPVASGHAKIAAAFWSQLSTVVGGPTPTPTPTATPQPPTATPVPPTATPTPTGTIVPPAACRVVVSINGGPNQYRDEPNAFCGLP